MVCVQYTLQLESGSEHMRLFFISSRCYLTHAGKANKFDYVAKMIYYESDMEEETEKEM